MRCSSIQTSSSSTEKTPGSHNKQANHSVGEFTSSQSPRSSHRSGTNCSGESHNAEPISAR
jgi:hypothetical protein